MITGADIAAEAKTWIGTPYVHQGRSKFGVDCIGFVICVRDALGGWPEAWDEVRNYRRTPKDDQLLQRITAHCTRLDAPEDGCVILIQWPLNKTPTHVAIYAVGNIIHAYQRAKMVTEAGFRAHWLRDTHSYWRLPGVRSGEH